MLQRSVLLLLVLSAMSCDEGPNRTTSIPRPSPAVPAPEPSPPSQPAPPPPVSAGRAIALGEEVKARLDGDNGRFGVDTFTVTATQNGTLVVRLVWDPYYWDTLLRLKIDDEGFGEQTSYFSPIVARVPAIAGKTYTLAIEFHAVGMAWITEYTLTAVIE